jgi:endoglycosylceramidase
MGMRMRETARAEASTRLILLSFALLTACGGDDDGRGGAIVELPALHATRGEDPGIFDSLGRQVLLRGVNLNSLGDYYQASPELPAVFELEPEFFEKMAAQGFNVVRLLLSWSALEPQRDHIDQSYLARIGAAVDAAEANGIYVVLDMHQDAWGKFIATPPGTLCTPGTEPAIGWDGAPQWATLTDGGDTCRQGSREFADAVSNAFRNFYEDTDGIQGQLVKTWAALAREFATETAVAGYDLINEPHFVAIDRRETAQQLGEFYSRAIDAIRAVERNAGGFDHIVFFEPLINFPLLNTTPPLDFTADENIVFAPHNYAESINSFFTIEQQFDTIRRWAARYRTTFWIGEYGWFSDPAANASRVARYGQQEDFYEVGGTWWQWLQACGDPHALSGAVAAGDFMPGPDAAPEEQIQYHLIGCPEDSYGQPIPEWRTVLARPRPLAAPGRIIALQSDGAAGTMHLEGDATGAAAGARLEIWAPQRGDRAPQLSGADAVEVIARAGGYHLSATVDGPYTVDLAPAD